MKINALVFDQETKLECCLAGMQRKRMEDESQTQQKETFFSDAQEFNFFFFSHFQSNKFAILLIIYLPHIFFIAPFSQKSRHNESTVKNTHTSRSKI